MYSYRFAGAAEKDLEEAYLWYEDQKPDLGVEFLDEIERACEYIAKAPQKFPFYIKDHRKLLLKAIGSKFKYYMILFRIRESSKRVIITAVAHSSRNPKTWKNR